MKQTIITLTALAALMLGGCARYMTYSDYKLDVQSGDQTAKVTTYDERYGTVYSFSDELYDMRVQVLLQSIAVEIDNKSDQTITIPVARIRYTDSNGVESSVITSSTPIEKRLDTPAPVTVAPGQTATLDLVPLKNIRFSKFNGFEREEIFPDFKRPAPCPTVEANVPATGSGNSAVRPPETAGESSPPGQTRFKQRIRAISNMLTALIHISFHVTFLSRHATALKTATLLPYLTLSNYGRQHLTGRTYPHITLSPVAARYQTAVNYRTTTCGRRFRWHRRAIPSG